MKQRVGRAMRPALGVAVITPVVLAGAVAAAPSRAGIAVGENATPPAPESTGAAVVAAAKPPANFRFAATSMSPPPPAAVVSAVGGMRIPAMALSAYRKAEQAMSVAAPGCGVSWNLLAGIGRIESSHANGGATDARGTAVRPIYGPALDGTLPGNEIIVQSSQAGRPVYARALGPMQFLPGTWSRYASDGDGDGRADPQNIFDATLSAARYLCSGGLNLRNQSQALTAILRYNNSMAYAQNVLGWAAAYATGVAPVDLPAITGPVPALGDTHLETSPAGLGPDMPGLHLGDPLADLGLNALGNSELAGQLSPGPSPAAAGPSAEHGCQVICMASQLPPSVTEAAQQNLPPWMLPAGTPGSPWTPPWMTPPAPAADVPTPLGVAPGPVPPGAVPPGAVPPGSVTPGAVPPGAVPPGPVVPPAAEAPVLAGGGAPGPVAPAPAAPGPLPAMPAEVILPPAGPGPAAEAPQGPGPLPGPAA